MNAAPGRDRALRSHPARPPRPSDLGQRLAGPRARISSLVAAEEAAAALLSEHITALRSTSDWLVRRRLRPRHVDQVVDARRLLRLDDRHVDGEPARRRRRRAAVLRSWPVIMGAVAKRRSWSPVDLPIRRRFGGGRLERPVWALLGLGLLLHLAIAVSEPPSGDMEHFRTAGRILSTFGFEAYGHLNAFDPREPFNYRHYSYPPGLLPWFWFAESVPADLFRVVSRVPALVAHVGLAWLVVLQMTIDRRPLGQRLATVGLIVLGPVFLDTVKSGQVDGFAMMFALCALLVWRADGKRRAVWAGLLIGLGAAVKTVPLVILVPLLLTARARSERLTLVVCASGVLVAAVAPFLAADPGGTVDSLAYVGFPGNGGWSLLVQPGLAAHAVGDYEFALSALNETLQDLGGVIAAVTVVLAGLIAWRRRLDAVRGSVLVTALLLFTTVNFFTQYAIWVMPFALLAGELPLVATIETAMLGMYLAYDALPTSAGRSLGSISVVANHRAALFYASYCLFLVAVGALAVRMAGHGRDRVDRDETRSITP